MSRRWRFVFPALVLVASLLGVWHTLPRLSAMAFIVRVAKPEGALARLARLWAGEVSVAPVPAIPTRHGSVPARSYRPAGAIRRTTLLVPGVHMAGIDEERLVGLARELAASGLAVLTVAPPALLRYRVATESVDELEDVIAWASRRPELAPDGKVGILGFSFSGGLALVAAGRPAVRERVAFALSFGGHADLARVLRYLCGESGSPPPATTGARALVFGAEHIHIPRPNDYGGVVALLNLADRLVPAAQVPPLQDAITRFLQASSLERVDPARAQSLFAQARRQGEDLAEPGRTLMRYVSDREVTKLGESLAPLLATLALPADLSPERASPPAAPVFLLHGADDAVVPASELLWLARDLGSRTRARAFATRLLSHAEVNPRAALVEMWQLAGFWQDVLVR